MKPVGVIHAAASGGIGFWFDVGLSSRWWERERK